MSRRYSSKVIDLFTNPVNVGEIENADGKAVEGSIACGDMISLTLKVNEKTGIIEDSELPLANARGFLLH